MMNKLQQFVDNKDNIGKEFTAKSGKVYKVSKIDNFEYTDPIDNSVTKNQVLMLYIQFIDLLSFQFNRWFMV